MGDSPLRIIGRSEIQRVLSMQDCIDAVERAFLAQADGRVLEPRITGTRVHGGGFHVKTAGLLDPPVYAAKINANFPGNPTAHGLPTVQGVVALFDAECGRVLAVMDSGEITRLRTAAASAVAAKYLARRDARTLTVCGCGVQGRAHLEALSVVRQVDVVYAFDVDRTAAERFARDAADRCGVDVIVADTLGAAARESDMIAMCTTSRGALLGRGDVRSGTFIAAVGADSEDKQELDPALLADAVLIVDDLEQCRTIGELHHAPHTPVRGDLASLVSGGVPGRTSGEEITIFDSTGTALEDVAAAALVFERAPNP
jgi:alanine dehydrogenase